MLQLFVIKHCGMGILSEHIQQPSDPWVDPGDMHPAHQTGKGNRGKRDKTSGKGKGKGYWGGKARRASTPPATDGPGQ
eukprot:7122428-Karenia_brevis.AAC.1